MEYVCCIFIGITYSENVRNIAASRLELDTHLHERRFSQIALSRVICAISAEPIFRLVVLLSQLSY